VGDLLIVQFHIQRIPGVIKKPEDVNTKKIDHSVELSHLSCITPHTFPHLIVPASIGTTFHHSAMVDCLEKEFKKKERVGQGTTVQ
jgi:hypothetical protein